MSTSIFLCLHKKGKTGPEVHQQIKTRRLWNIFLNPWRGWGCYFLSWRTLDVIFWDWYSWPVHDSHQEKIASLKTGIWSFSRFRGVQMFLLDYLWPIGFLKVVIYQKKTCHKETVTWVMLSLEVNDYQNNIVPNFGMIQIRYSRNSLWWSRHFFETFGGYIIFSRKKSKKKISDIPWSFG